MELTSTYTFQNLVGGDGLLKTRYLTWFFLFSILPTYATVGSQLVLGLDSLFKSMFGCRV